MAPFLAGVGTGLVAGLVIGVLVRENGESDTATTSRLPSIAQVADNPSRFFRRTVTVAGEVDEIRGPRAFTVGGAEFGGERLLVVARKPIAAPAGRSAGRPVLENDLVHVTGSVRLFDSRRFEDEIDATLRDDLTDLEQKPALLAESVLVSPRLYAVTGRASASQIVRRPRDFYGELVAVEGRVTAVPTRELVVIDGKLPVLRTSAVRLPAKGARVRISGPVRRFDIDQLERRAGRELDEPLFADAFDRPTLVAQRVSEARE